RWNLVLEFTDWHVANDADDAHRISTDQQSLPDRVLVLEVCRHERPIHDRHPRGIRIVGGAERASIHYRNAHRSEIVRARLSVAGRRHLTWRRRWTSGDVEPERVA